MHYFKVQLNMENSTTNCIGKIWFFWNNDIDFTILDEDEQQITWDIKQNELKRHVINTLFYAKCKDYLRRPLWDKILQ